MSKRKSIVSAFGDFRNDPKSEDAAAKPESEDAKPKAKRVAAGIIGTTQRTLTDIREERDALLEQAASGNQVIQLDPEVIDPSPFRDRLPDDNEMDFELFKKSLSDEGQKVPITVRRNPDDDLRFQIVYGHRRWRGLKELGKKAEAVIAEYSDRDLVIAQGIENANRQDLTWIERALFANEMQVAGIKPRDIKAALGIDDAELSKLRSAIKSIPQNVIELIGRAPSVGRPRWLDLGAAIKNKTDISKIEKTLSADKVSKISSDERFLLALQAVSSDPPKSAGSGDQLNMKLGEIGSIAMMPNAIKINLAKEHREGFKKFLKGEMTALVRRYRDSLED